ncbi:MAG: DoxX family membrane protein [Chitinophagales bacterium]|nr:DoxX family membrane protein [Chitinophagales bacterium]MDW8428014.1 DoxX family membrane protein [Chitinophagales bacterium]
MSNMLPFIGRVIFALAMAYFGIGHFTNGQNMTGYLPASMSSVALPLIYISGAGLLLAAVSFIINKWMRLAAILLALFLVLTVIIVHMPGLSSEDQAAKMSSMIAIVKDLALAGAALVISGDAKD